MGQQEVYDFLRAHCDEHFTSRQIATALSCSVGSVTMSLKKLRKSKIVEFERIGVRNTFKYRCPKKNAGAEKAKILLLIVVAIRSIICLAAAYFIMS